MPIDKDDADALRNAVKLLEHPSLAARLRDGMVAEGVSIEATNVRFGSLADKPSGAEIHHCPLWSKSRQTRARSDCPLSANSRHGANILE
jgi:hypothetical protein